MPYHNVSDPGVTYVIGRFDRFMLNPQPLPPRIFSGYLFAR